MSTKFTLRTYPGVCIEVGQDSVRDISLSVTKTKQEEVVISLSQSDAFRLGKFLLSLVGK